MSAPRCNYEPGDPMFYTQRGCDAEAEVTLYVRGYPPSEWTRRGHYCRQHATTTAYRRHGDIPGGWHYSGRVRYVRLSDGQDVRPVKRSWEATDQYADVSV